MEAALKQTGFINQKTGSCMCRERPEQKVKRGDKGQDMGPGERGNESNRRNKGEASATP